MATYTTNLNLKKPAYTDPADIADINSNMDTIDSLAGAGRTTETVKGNADDLATHMAENVSQLIVVTRDASLAGTQVVSLPFKAKTIIANAFIVGLVGSSNGFWAENNLQRLLARRSDNIADGQSKLIKIEINSTTHIEGTIQNVNDSGFEIEWTKLNSPTGTVIAYILALTHGGV